MSTTPGFDRYHKRQFLNFTSLATFARCPRKYFYQAGVFLTKERIPAFEFGEGLHNAIPQLLSGDPKTTIERAIKSFDACWDGTLDDEKRSRGRAIAMLIDFQSNHQPGRALYELVHPRDLPFAVDSKLDISDRVSEYEIPFAIDIGLSIPLVGRIDAIGRLRDSGELCAVEYKTTSHAWNFFDAFQLSPQALTYNAALRASGIEVNKCIVERLEVSKTKTSTLAMPIDIRPYHVEANLDWVRFISSHLLHCEQAGHFPQHFTGCHPYAMFGAPGYLCEYYSLCQPPDWTTNASLFVTKPDRRYEILFPDGRKTEVK